MTAPSPPGLKSSIEYLAMSVGIGRTLYGHRVSSYFFLLYVICRCCQPTASSALRIIGEWLQTEAASAT